MCGVLVDGVQVHSALECYKTRWLDHMHVTVKLQVGHENRLFDLIHHVFGCKHHKASVTRQWYLHTLRANQECGLG